MAKRTDNLLKSKRPDLWEQLDFDKNEDEGIEVDGLTCGSTKKAWFFCDKGHNHSFLATVANRNMSKGCSYCSGKKVLKGFNCLESSNPYLASEWDYTKNENVYPGDVLAKSGKKYWWLCPKGHSYCSPVNNRQKGRGCAICSSKKVSASENSLMVTNKELASEWHPTLNGELTPKEVTSASGRKVWWTCVNGHGFQSTVNNRKYGRGCAQCSLQGTSKSEKTLVDALSTLLGSEESSIFSEMFSMGNFRTIDGLFFVESTPIFVEYDGGYFHKDRFDKDLEKSTHLYTKGLVIRLRENDLELLPEHPNLFQKNVPYGDDEAMQTFVDEAVAWARERVAEMKPTS